MQKRSRYGRQHLLASMMASVGHTQLAVLCCAGAPVTISSSIGRRSACQHGSSSLPILLCVGNMPLTPACIVARFDLQVGNYFSTKIWSFTMRHHCGCKITITTDPKNAEYIVTDGARRKIETYDAEDAQVSAFASTLCFVADPSAARVVANRILTAARRSLCLYVQRILLARASPQAQCTCALGRCCCCIVAATAQQFGMQHLIGELCTALLVLLTPLSLCFAPCLFDLQTIELPDANERAAVAADPLASLEHQTLQARKAASGRAQLVALTAEREAKGRDPYSLNKTLRAAMRQAKKKDAQLDAE